MNFDRFIGIDWSGAKGRLQRGLAVCMCDQNGRVSVMEAPGGQRWSRPDVANLLRHQLADARTLVGIDSSFSLPFVDAGAYLPRLDTAGAPGWDTAQALWAAVDACCNGDETLYAGDFVKAYEDWFQRPGHRGLHAESRYRRTETRYNQLALGRAETSFKLIGPSQVGLSALSTMRMLHRCADDPNIGLWPFDRNDAAPVCIVECFATFFAARCGRRGKVRDRDELAALLGQYGASIERKGTVSDHIADAALIAAGLRALAPQDRYWQPGKLCDTVRRTEGWIFGVA